MSATYNATTGRLSDLAHTLGAADLARFAYGYNAVGSITGIAEPAADDRSFAYDALQRLTAGGTAALPESYGYDAEGNRLVSHLSAAHLTDAGNRLIQDDGFDYAYDDNGNLATKTDRATLGVTAYSYDAQDQLVRIDFPDATFATYAHDALGRRGPGRPAASRKKAAHRCAASSTGRRNATAGRTCRRSPRYVSQ